MANDLASKMRTLASQQEADTAQRLVDLVDKFERAAAGFYSEPQTVSAKSFLGAWARARRVYCEITGEALI